MSSLLYRKLLIFVFILICSGCSDYDIINKTYKTEHKAVIAFYKNNVKVLKSLTSKQEMLGWVMKCKDGYRITTPKIGTTSNSIKEPRNTSECLVIANMHTHPKPPYGMIADFFSPEDLKSSRYWRMYLLAQENCNIRYTYKPDKKYGILLGRIKKCS